ncbi:MAG: CPBP family intramembrane metalloprotease [Clostridiales bacterium]|nr:CPBP family intramembrane metalloprotease [Clostridiales bacterium]
MQQTQTVLNRKSGLAGVGFSFVIFIYVLLTLVGGLILSLIEKEGGLLTRAISCLYAPLAITVVLVLLSRYQKQKITITANVKKCNIKFYGIAVLIAGGMFLGLGFVNVYLSQVFAGWGIKVSENVLPLDTIWHYLLFSVLLAVLPAITEEALFRGFLTQGTRALGVIIACVVSSLAFALYHSSLSQFAYQFIYGVVLYILTIKAGSVIPAILAHFLNNFAIISLTYFNVSLDMFSPVIISVGLVTLALGLLFLFVPFKKADKCEKAEKGIVKQEVASFFITASVGMLVCILLIVLGAVGV